MRANDVRVIRRECTHVKRKRPLLRASACDQLLGICPLADVAMTGRLRDRFLQVLDRFVERHVGCRQRFTEVDVRLFDGDVRRQTFLVDHGFARREIEEMREQQAAAVRELHGAAARRGPNVRSPTSDARLLPVSRREELRGS